MSAGDKTKVMPKFLKKYCSVSAFRVRACLEAQALLAASPILLSSVAPIWAATGDNFISNLQHLTSTSESAKAVRQMLNLQLLSLPSPNPWQRPAPTTARGWSRLRPWSYRWRLQPRRLPRALQELVGIYIYIYFLYSALPCYCVELCTLVKVHLHSSAGTTSNKNIL